MNALTDSDGELRSVPLVAQLKSDGQNRYYPSLSLAMFMTLLGQVEVRLLPVDEYPLYPGLKHHLGGFEVRQGADALRIPTNIHGAVLVPFRSDGGRGGGRFRYVSAADVLDGKFQPGELQGRIALFQSGVYNLKNVSEGARFEWGIAPLSAGPKGAVSVVNSVMGQASFWRFGRGTSWSGRDGWSGSLRERPLVSAS